MSALPSTTPCDEYLNEQLINCLNIQTNVIQNLAQYSQHITLQLIEIKNNVNLLTNRINILQQQQEQRQQQILSPPSNPLLFFPSPWLNSSVGTNPSVPFSFAPAVDQHLSRAAEFLFGPRSSNNVTYSDEENDDDDDDEYVDEDDEDDDGEEDDDDDDDDEQDGSPIPFDSLRSFLRFGMKIDEKDENILFCEHAQLYHFDPSINQLVQRGTGELLILQHRTTHLSHLLMLQDEELGICARHQLTPQLELNPHQGIPHAYIWSVFDFADGETRYETLCVRFKTDEQGRKFVRIFNEAKENLPSIERISLNENQSPSKGSQHGPSSNESQLNNQIDSYFPSAFFSKRSPMKSYDSSSTSRAPNWSSDEANDSYPSPPKTQRQIIKAKRSLPSNRVPPPPVSTHEQSSPEISQQDEIPSTQANQKKSRNLSAHQPSNRSMDQYAVKVVENILDDVKQELHQQPTIVTIEEDNSKSSPTGFSFANFGTNADFQFSSETPSTFANLLRLDFADRTPPSYAAEEQNSSISENNTNDENILFSERAELSSTEEQEFVEIKILQNSTNNLVRMIIHRDEHSDVYLNQQIELKPHPDKIHAYICSCKTSSNEELQTKTFCVKFQTSDIAERFAKHFK